MDALIDLLRAMRFSGGVFLDADFTAPWSVTAQVGPEDCRPFTAEPRHIIAYHYVTEGRLLLEVEGQEPVAVGGGEIVVLPRNDHHVLSSGPNGRTLDAEQLIQPGPNGGLAKIVHGGGGERTRVLCGFLCNDLPQSVFIAMLPRVLKLEIADAASINWIESSLRFAAAQLSEGGVPSPAMLAKLAELLFMEAVRRYLASRSPVSDVWSAGLQDPVVGRALGLLHQDIARHWTTEELAREAALSRSAFAERFTRLVGEPPMRYLARQRFEQASAQLRETSLPIAQIAFAAGYESETAFNRAFRRAYGLPPATWRREQVARKA